MFSKEFIINSSLSQEDKDLWLAALGKMNADQIRVAEDFIHREPENLRLLTINLRSKINAIATLDEKLIEKIMEEEQGAPI